MATLANLYLAACMCGREGRGVGGNVGGQRGRATKSGTTWEGNVGRQRERATWEGWGNVGGQRLGLALVWSNAGGQRWENVRGWGNVGGLLSLEQPEKHSCWGPGWGHSRNVAAQGWDYMGSATGRRGAAGR